MNSRSGLSFADVLIMVAVVMLLAALAIPKFVEAPDYGNEEDDAADVTNAVPAYVGAITNVGAASAATGSLSP